MLELGGGGAGRVGTGAGLEGPGPVVEGPEVGRESAWVCNGVGEKLAFRLHWELSFVVLCNTGDEIAAERM